jgi:hypothetical protein
LLVLRFTGVADYVARESIVAKGRGSGSVLETSSYSVERKRLAWILCSFVGALEKGDSWIVLAIRVCFSFFR